MFRLTSEQAAAVEHAGTGGRRHLLIVAGAGSGKTTTLAARLAHLVERGVAPERILLLTFSRRAASELLRRAEHHGGQAVARRVWGGTFHAVASRLLRMHGSALGLDPGFTVLDGADTADLLALVRAELLAHDGDAPTGHRRAKKDTMTAILSRVVNTTTPLSAVLRRDFPWCSDEHEELKATFAAYVARKRAASVLDYDDLLVCWHALLQSRVAPVLQAQFDHVLVDEYQDTNALQADILEQLARGGATVTAVGDDAQAIYGFRNATPRNILDFPSRFDADVALLEQNHRSTPELLHTTNAIIAAAPERHVKHLWSTRPSAARAALVTCADEGAQSAAVCERILAQHERGVRLREQAVLFRAAHHSDLLELELGARRIPFVKYGGLRFLEAAHVKDLVASLRVVVNPRDELAWFRVLQLLDGVGPATARKLAPRGPSITASELPAGGADLLASLTEARGRQAGRRGRPCARLARPGRRVSVPARGGPRQRPRRAHVGRRLVQLPRAVPRRAHPRSARVHRRAGRTASPRRRLARPLHDPLRQGGRVGRGPPAPRERRLPALRHGDRRRGPDRGGTAPPLCGHHPRDATASGATSRCATTTPWAAVASMIGTATPSRAASSPTPSWRRSTARATPPPPPPTGASTTRLSPTSTPRSSACSTDVERLVKGDCAELAELL